MKRILLLGMLVLLACTSRLVLAQTPELEPGSSLRVTPKVEREPDVWRAPVVAYVGTLVESLGDTLLLDTKAHGLVRLPASRIACLEIGRDARGTPGTGALLGGVGLGLIVGGAMMMSASNCDGPCTLNLFGEDERARDGNCCRMSSPVGAFAAGFVLGLVPGALIGAVAGAASRTPIWEEVPLGAGAQLQTTFSARGLSILVRF